MISSHELQIALTVLWAVLSSLSPLSESPRHLNQNFSSSFFSEEGFLPAKEAPGISSSVSITWAVSSEALLEDAIFFVFWSVNRDLPSLAFRHSNSGRSTRLHLWIRCILASYDFTSSRKVSRATDSWTGGSQSDLTWKGWGSFSSPWKIYCSHIGLANWLKSARSWRLIRFSFVTGVGINFRPRDSRVICSSVSCSFDRFLTSCLCDSMVWQKRFLSLIFLRSFLSRFWPLCYLCG